LSEGEIVKARVYSDQHDLQFDAVVLAESAKEMAKRLGVNFDICGSAAAAFLPI
jgi:hypothetical protein